MRWSVARKTGLPVLTHGEYSLTMMPDDAVRLSTEARHSLDALERALYRLASHHWNAIAARRALAAAFTADGRPRREQLADIHWQLRHDLGNGHASVDVSDPSRAAGGVAVDR